MICQQARPRSDRVQVCRGVCSLSEEEVVQTHNTDRQGRGGDDKVLLITTGDAGSHDVRGGPNPLYLLSLHRILTST